ncbi:hypothetical protein MMC16_006283 [Acarospora aff. strigata]|nr:hypothetical protein [Acarospora aff. strigata]
MVKQLANGPRYLANLYENNNRRSIPIFGIGSAVHSAASSDTNGKRGTWITRRHARAKSLVFTASEPVRLTARVDETHQGELQGGDSFQFEEPLASVLGC